MVDLQFSGEALADLAEISTYGADRWGEAQSEHYLRVLDGCFKQLAQTPFIGRVRPELVADLRSWLCHEHTVFYLVDKDAIVVVRVLSTRRDVRGLFGSE